jgi:anti-sigma factor RsiW
MKDPKELVAKALRGDLLKTEQVEWERLLQNDPETRRSFEEEKALEQLLDRLPDAPLSSNFTSLVLQAAARENKTEASWSSVSRWRLPFRSVFARVAGSLALVLVLGLVIGRQYRKAEDSKVARQIQSVTQAASEIASVNTPPEEVFRDFEAIQRLSAAGNELDMELLVALQK